MNPVRKLVRGYVLITALIGALAVLYLLVISTLPYEEKILFLVDTKFFHLFNNCVFFNGPGPGAEDEARDIDNLLERLENEIQEVKSAGADEEQIIDKVVSLAEVADSENKTITFRAIRKPEHKEDIELYIIGGYFMSAYIFEAPEYAGKPIVMPVERWYHEKHSIEQ